MNELKYIFHQHNITLSKPIILIKSEKVTIISVKDVLNCVLGLRAKQRQRMISNFQYLQNDKSRLMNYCELIANQMLTVRL
jgi:hypothetical protein